MEKTIPEYVFRQEQVNLAGAVGEAFANREFLVAEVGTGVGKTYAYLVPAVLWALTEGEKVVVSTRTRALQEQIIDNDIPAIQEVMEKEFRFAEAKGRENYLCWNKYIGILSGHRALAEEEQDFIQAVLKWAESTSLGDRKELNLPGSMMKHWHLLAADRKSCRKDLCRYHERCFRMKMMKRLQKADLIIVNHALLLSDLMVDNSILPEYKNLIIDEAHTFDRESFDKLSATLSREETTDVLNMLYSRDRKYARGYLQYLKGRYPNLMNSLNDLSTRVYACRERLQEMFTGLDQACVGGEAGYARVLNRHHLESSWFADFIDNYLEWQYSINLVITGLSDLRQELAGEDEEIEVRSMMISLQECSHNAYIVLEENLEREDAVTWLDFHNRQVAGISSSSARTGDILQQRLYSKLDSLVMVSATLAVENRFDYFVEKVGLGEIQAAERLNTLLETSPFSYDKQAMLLAVKDLPDPTNSRFTEQMVEMLGDIIKATRGRTMILFTARKQMQEASAVLRNMAKEHGLELLVQQEDGEFGVLLENFTSRDNTILMGLETFWEGVDLKGEVLEYLVIVKLPFRSPTDPYSCAGERFCQLQRKNSFSSFMLPDAAVRFKQGTGRLIRSENDRGLVIILDSRLEGRSYGKVFKSSIPIKRVVPVKKSQLIEKINSLRP